MPHEVTADDRERAELYRALHSGTPGDVAFYVSACAQARRVLELGCGSGRLLAPLAEAGLEVVGLDQDPALLALAREALSELAPEARDRVTLLQGDMSDFALEGHFDRIIIPFTGFYALDGPAVMARCLERVRAHLAPAGALLLDAYAVDPAECRKRRRWDSGFEEVLRIPWRGQEVPVLERNVIPGPPCRVEVTYRFVLGDREVEQHLRHHFLSWPMLDAMLEAAGFGQAAARGGFEGEPFTDSSPHMVVIAAP